VVEAVCRVSNDEELFVYQREDPADPPGLRRGTIPKGPIGSVAKGFLRTRVALKDSSEHHSDSPEIQFGSYFNFTTLLGEISATLHERGKISAARFCLFLSYDPLHLWCMGTATKLKTWFIQPGMRASCSRTKKLGR
jgi:hypothetical protein